MAKHRKRFYVGIRNTDAATVKVEVLSLKHTPQPDLYGFLFLNVVGPFRTRADADNFAAPFVAPHRPQLSLVA